MSEFVEKQRYYLKTGLAYTEDDILVTSLSFTHYEWELNSINHRQTFEVFGPLVRFYMFPVKKHHLKATRQRIQRNGYVIFADPLSAVKALECRDFSGCLMQLNIKASPSWHQPDAQSLSSNPINADPNDVEPADIMKLNDHCLENILCYLSTTDRIHFARTCSRFRNIYMEMSPKLDKVCIFQEFQTMTEWDLREFFKLSGRNIRRISGKIQTRHCRRIFEFLGKFCINLQSIAIEEMHHLFSCSKGRRFYIYDDDLNSLSHLSQLKELDISDSIKLTGNFYLPQSLESLTLTECSGIDTRLFNYMFRNIKQLKVLNMFNISLSSSTWEMFRYECLNSLETLTISCYASNSSEYEYIARLPSLKKLTLYIHNDGIVTPILVSLINYKSEHLEHLEIYTLFSIDTASLLKIGRLSALRKFHCIYSHLNDLGLEALSTLENLEEINIASSQHVTNNGVFRLILSCPKLQVLFLNECRQITDQLLKDIELKLQKNPSNRPLPIKLSMSRTIRYEQKHPYIDSKIINVTYSDYSPYHDNMVRMLV